MGGRRFLEIIVNEVILTEEFRLTWLNCNNHAGQEAPAPVKVG